MENVAELLDLHCTFPTAEKVKLFRRTLFSCLISNVGRPIEQIEELALSAR